MTTPVYRFAPSPNGLLHLGHAYSALVNLRLAREAGGVMLLRIEDIDTARCTPQKERMMLEDLEWIGFEWDRAPRRQSQHFDDYRAAIETLVAAGLVYPSTMSRAEMRRAVGDAIAHGGSWPCDPDGTPHYPGRERELGTLARQRILEGDADYALRLDNAAARAELPQSLQGLEAGSGPHGETGWIDIDLAAWGDVVLARKDIPASYHLACVVDDGIQ
ncbi:MAG: glutamate--tRNA ligase family protein, partial [Pseudomonadota bacterium]|nr:glutamate--tRNA ligase family protein [Pseudomonadota bacterium]